MLKEKIQAENPQVSELEGRELVIELMDISHHVVKNIETDPERYDKERPFDNFEKAQNLDDYGHYCGGMSTTFIDIVRAFGFRGAVIQLITESGETHVSSEVFLNGVWQAFDPTFNVTLEVDGEPAKYSDLTEESSVVYSLNGKSAVRDLESYYVPYSEFYFNVYDHYRD